MLSKLQKYRQAKQEHETAQAEFNRGLEAVTAELRKLHHLDSLREEVELWRGWVDADALLANERTGDKTVFSEGGFVVTVAVTEKPVVTDAEAVFAAIDAAKLSANLAERKLKLRPFGKWAKTQRDIGAEVPGVEFQESKSVRVTLPKATEQEAAE